MKNRLIGLFSMMALIPVLAFAHGYGWNQGWGGHMGFMGGGWMMILWVLLIGLLIAGAAKWIFGSKNTPVTSTSALTILADRYAKGEISREDFEVMKKTVK